MYCNSCGAPVKDGQSFCANCGAPVTHPVQPAPQSVIQPVQPSQPVYQQPMPQVTSAVPAAPVQTTAPQMPPQQIQAQNATSVNKVPTAAKVLGWISMVLSCLGMIGVVLILIAAAMPSYQGSSVQIQSEDVSKAAVFFLGMCIGYMLSPVGGLLGIISMIIMLIKRSRKMIWLPITGAAIGLIAFVGTTLAGVFLIATLS